MGTSSSKSKDDQVKLEGKQIAVTKSNPPPFTEDQVVQNEVSQLPIFTSSVTQLDVLFGLETWMLTITAHRKDQTPVLDCASDLRVELVHNHSISNLDVKMTGEGVYIAVCRRDLRSGPIKLRSYFKYQLISNHTLLAISLKPEQKVTEKKDTKSPIVDTDALTGVIEERRMLADGIIWHPRPLRSPLRSRSPSPLRGRKRSRSPLVRRSRSPSPPRNRRWETREATPEFGRGWFPSPPRKHSPSPPRRRWSPSPRGTLSLFKCTKSPIMQSPSHPYDDEDLDSGESCEMMERWDRWDAPRSPYNGTNCPTCFRPYSDERRSRSRSRSRERDQ